jgi:DNA-binding MarR family transcriptional regulator
LTIRNYSCILHYISEEVQPVSESDREAMIAAILTAQHAIMRLAPHRAKADWLPLDLSMAQLKAMMLMVAAPPMTASQLATTLGLGRPATSILIDHLVQDGMVTRTEDPIDRRRVLVELTPTGSDLVARLRQGPRDRLRHLLEQLAPADLAALLQGMEALAAAVTNDAPEPV